MPKEGLSGVKLNPFDKVRLRPAAYIGEVKNIEKEEWVFDEDTQTIVKKLIKYNTGMLHLFVEILSNAIDNTWRSKDFGYKMTYISIEANADPTSDSYGWMTIKNDGYPIPVELREYTHENYRTGKVTKEMAYPADYFWGEFDAGTNYKEDWRRKSSGLHGIGGKIVTALSSQVIIDHADPNNKKKYYKSYQGGGKVQGKPSITPYVKKNGYTSVSFLPDADYEFFLPNSTIDDDFVSLIKRYAYEASMITGLKVFFNEEEVVVKNLEKYSRFFYPDAKEHKLIRFAAPNGDECVIVSGDIPEVNVMEKPPQVSWVNGINTSEGGIHVDAWTRAIFPKLVKAFNTKKRGKNVPEIKVTAKRLYPWLTLYVRAESFGALFESNAKKIFTSYKINETETSDKIVLNEPESEEFTRSINEAVKKIMKWDFISFIEEQLIAEAETQSNKDNAKVSSKFIEEKYEDANMVEKEPENCILIICEGSSAHAMARKLVPNLPGGRDYWGVYELRGKFLNLSKAATTKINSNKEFKVLKQMTGLIPLTDYSTLESRKSLRYGGFWLLTDADPDGMHIRGLVLSSLNTFWPSIISKNPKDTMLSDMQTYAVTVYSKDGKLTKGYYTVEEFEKEKASLDKGSYVRYLKGLGTHKPEEIQSYLEKELMVRTFYKDPRGTKAIEMAFVDGSAGRKEWMMNALKSGQKPDNFQLNGNLSLSKFVYNDMVPYVIMSLDRAIPSIWDGLKDSQRKCIYGGLKQKYPKPLGAKEMLSVTGEIKSITQYHHGELGPTVARMGQYFPGSNNINYFKPDGLFGTRELNGTDIAKERYLQTGPEEICSFIFSGMDDPILERRDSDDGRSKLEYKHYVPVIPMILVNGCEGIATGWASTIPCYNPLDLVAWIRAWLKGTSLKKPLKPWYRGYKGTIELLGSDGKPWDPSSGSHPAKWLSRGILTKTKEPWDKPPYTKGSKKVKDPKWVIEEIPIGLSINAIKTHINFFMTGVKTMKGDKAKSKEKKVAKAKGKPQVTARIKPRLRDFRNYSKSNSPWIEILPTKDFVPDIDTKGNFDLLKKVHSFNKMYLLNAEGIPTKYSTPEEILQEWCELRKGVYTERMKWWLSRWERDRVRQSQKYKFVKMVRDGTLDLHQKADELEKNMISLGLQKLVQDSKWKSAERQVDEGFEEPETEGSFDYLLSMQMRSMTVEKLAEIKKEIEKIEEKIEHYQTSSEADIWEEDLQSFEQAYQKFLKTRIDD